MVHSACEGPARFGGGEEMRRTSSSGMDIGDMDAGASKSRVTDSCGAVGEKERAKAPTSDCAAYAARLMLRGRSGGLRGGSCALWGDVTREPGRLCACIGAALSLRERS